MTDIKPHPREGWAEQIDALITAGEDSAAEFSDLAGTDSDGLDYLAWDGLNYEEWLRRFAV